MNPFPNQQRWLYAFMNTLVNPPKWNARYLYGNICWVLAADSRLMSANIPDWDVIPKCRFSSTHTIGNSQVFFVFFLEQSQPAEIISGVLQEGFESHIPASCAQSSEEQIHPFWPKHNYLCSSKKVWIEKVERLSQKYIMLWWFINEGCRK